MPLQPIDQGAVLNLWIEQLRAIATFTPQFNAAALFTVLGERGLASLSLGLSRKVTAESDDLRKLIFEWESRCGDCYYKGPLEALLQEHKAGFLAVSYRHVEKSEWSHKNKDQDSCGTTLISKMSSKDQELFVEAVQKLAVYKKVNKFYIWCDQIISTRLDKSPELKNDIPWYTAGLLPYASMPVLSLNSDWDPTELENRIWIRAERSLARMTRGILPAPFSEDAIQEGENQSPDDAFRTLSQLVNSKAWPADTGYWNDDYRQMKDWALSLACATRDTTLPVTEKLPRATNLDMISSVGYLAVPPKGELERPFWTVDQHFFLKAYGFNLCLEGEWDMEPSYVSHYMGRLTPGNEFTWWDMADRAIVFGILIQNDEVAIRVLAMRQQVGYKVFRSVGNIENYMHGEKIAGPKVQAEILGAATLANLTLPEDIGFTLLYCSDEGRLRDKFMPLQKWFRSMGTSNVIPADAAISEPFRNMTVKLLVSAISSSDDPIPEEIICEKAILAADAWKAHIEELYDEFISVCDTRNGLVWYEGVRNGHVTFGFLHVLTETLILGKSSLCFNEILLPTAKDAFQFISQVVVEFSQDRQDFVATLLENVTQENVSDFLKPRDTARLVLSGAFTKFLTLGQFSTFLAITAQEKGFWVTRVVCRAGRTQIRFFNRSEARIGQWKTSLKCFTALGIVCPKDSAGVLEISKPMETRTGAETAAEENRIASMYASPVFFDEYMEDTTTREESISAFPNSIRTNEDGTRLFLVDMVRTKTGTEIEPNNVAIEGDKTAMVTAEMAEALFLTLDYENEVQGNAFWDRHKQRPTE